MVNELLFEQLFRMYYAELCRYASRYLSDKQIVEDIVQSFFIAVWEKDGLTINGDNFLPYAYRSVYNRCLNYYKAELSKESFLASLVEECINKKCGRLFVNYPLNVNKYFFLNV